MCNDCQRLTQQNHELQREVRQLRYKIARATDTCEAVQARANPILSQRSGVPRGLWSRVKGRVDVADLVLKVLG